VPIGSHSTLYDPQLEAMPEEQRRAYRTERLRAAVQQAYAHSPDFRRRAQAAGMTPDALRTAEDLIRLPILRKSALPEVQAADPPFGGVLGVPLSRVARIFQSPGPIYEPEGCTPDYWRMARAFYAGGFRAGDIVQVTFAYHLAPGGWICDSGLRALGCIVVPAGVGNTEAQVRLLRDLRVTGLVGTAAFLCTLLAKAEESGIDVANELSLRVASVSGAMMAESTRRLMAERYRLPVRQIYAIGDLGLVAYECQEAAGMHIADDLILQIVDPQTGEEVAVGEPGEVVVTTFDPVYPLIRFGTGDLSSIMSAPCPCGRTSARLTGVLGRVDEITKIKGVFVHPRQLDALAEAVPEVRRCQIVVRLRGHEDEVSLRVELEGGMASMPVMARLREQAKAILRVSPTVEVVPPGTIAEGAKAILDERRWD